MSLRESRRRSPQQAELERPAHELGAPLEAQLAHQARALTFRGPHRHMQFTRDIPVGMPIGEQDRRRALALREGVFDHTHTLTVPSPFRIGSEPQ